MFEDTAAIMLRGEVKHAYDPFKRNNDAEL